MHEGAARSHPCRKPLAFVTQIREKEEEQHLSSFSLSAELINEELCTTPQSPHRYEYPHSTPSALVSSRATTLRRPLLMHAWQTSSTFSNLSHTGQHQSQSSGAIHSEDRASRLAQSSARHAEHPGASTAQYMVCNTGRCSSVQTSCQRLLPPPMQLGANHYCNVASSWKRVISPRTLYAKHSFNTPLRQTLLDTQRSFTLITHLPEYVHKLVPCTQ